MVKNRNKGIPHKEEVKACFAYKLPHIAQSPSAGGFVGNNTKLFSLKWYYPFSLKYCNNEFKAN